TNTAIFQPEFSPDGHYLAYISDAGDWNQLYIYDLAQQTHKQLTTTEADHGAPAWVQGMRVYAWAADSKSLIYRESKEGFSSLWRVDIQSGKCSPIAGL